MREYGPERRIENTPIKGYGQPEFYVTQYSKRVVKSTQGESRVMFSVEDQYGNAAELSMYQAALLLEYLMTKIPRRLWKS